MLLKLKFYEKFLKKNYYYLERLNLYYLYLKYIKTNWPAFIRYKAYDLLNHSSLKAIWGNIDLFTSVRWNNLYWIIRSYLKLLVKRIINK